MARSNPLSVEQQIQRYLPLIERFTEGEIDARQFEEFYMDLVESGGGILDPRVADVVYQLFGDADFYEPYEHLRNSETLDDAELLECAVVARNKLLEIDQANKNAQS